jgi:hypothetical protein
LSLNVNPRREKTMDFKKIEELADLIVGKVTMPGHAFAGEVCIGTQSYITSDREFTGSKSDFVKCVPQFDCYRFLCNAYYIEDGDDKCWEGFHCQTWNTYYNVDDCRQWFDPECPIKHLYGF